MHDFDKAPGSHSFKPLPEIYQIETVAACDLDCPMCYRSSNPTSRVKVGPRGGSFLNPALLTRMIQRGDFKGSYYTELQMSGEPTLHPELGVIIANLKKTGVIVGMSTHGHHIIDKATKARLDLVDVLTISLDSLDPEEYAKLRPPRKLDHLIENIDWWLNGPRPETQQVHLQLVVGLGVPGAEVERRLDEVRRRWPFPNLVARAVRDCFADLQGRVAPKSRELCLNPWTSVSVQSDGAVVTCCYSFNKEYDANILGDLNTQTLEEIWSGPKAAEMRSRMESGKLENTLCDKCYIRSPVLLHLDFLAKWMQGRGETAK